MITIVDEAKKIFAENLSITQEDYIRFKEKLDVLEDDEKIKLAEILLIKVCESPSFITTQDLEVFKKLLPLSKLTDNLVDSIFWCEYSYGSAPIFKDNSVAKKVADILNLVNRNEYIVICALLNNGFGDKEYLKKYLNSLNPKIFDYSPKWKSMYIKAINYCSK